MEATTENQAGAKSAASSATVPTKVAKSDSFFLTLLCGGLLGHHVAMVQFDRGGFQWVLPLSLYILFVISIFYSGFAQQDHHVRNAFVASYICDYTVPITVVRNTTLGLEFILLALHLLLDVVIVGRVRPLNLLKTSLNYVVALYLRLYDEPHAGEMLFGLFGLTVFAWAIILTTLCGSLEFSARLRATFGVRVLRIYAAWDTVTALCLRQLSACDVLFGLKNSCLDEKTPPFAYEERLSRYEIRLLVLARRKLGRPPHFQLVRKGLMDLPDFVACSYVWGDHTASHVVGVLGSFSVKHLRVTSSLYSLLCREQSFFSTKTLWIDAVCINQSDMVEKATQVAIMRSIFARASRVHAVFDSSLQSAGLRGWLHFSDKESRFHPNDRFYCRFSGEAEGMSTASDLDEFFRTEWLQRVWILQEAVVARRLTILYRTMNIEWDQYVALLSLISVDIPPLSITTTGTRARRARTMELATQLKRASLVQATKTDWTEGTNTLSLTTLMERSQLSHASEERDKVYALLGMSEIDYRIPLDYSLPLTKIYAEAVFSILREEQDFKFLCCPALQQLSSTTVQLPSWIVPWTGEDSRPIKPWLTEHQRADFRTTTPFEANLQPFSGQNWALVIKHLHSVEKLASVDALVPCDDFDDFDDARDDVQEALQKLLRQQWDVFRVAATHYGSRPKDLKSLRQSFWHTLTLGRFDAEDRDVSANDHLDAFRILDKYLSITLDRGSSGRDDALYSGIEDAFASREGPYHVRKQLQLVSSEIISTLRGRVFGVSSTDQAVMLPKETEEGDRIITLNNSPLPLVLRQLPPGEQPYGPKFRFVGPCYSCEDVNADASVTEWQRDRDGPERTRIKLV